MTLPHKPFKPESTVIGCLVLLVLIAIGLSIGFGIAAALTWLLSVLGVVEFSVVNSLAVWGVIIILGLIFSR